MNEKFDIILDEDYFAKEKLKLTEKQRMDIVRKYISLSMFVRENILKTRKISLITFHRWDNVLWGRHNNFRHELMMPSKFNKMFGVKPINMKYFKTAEKKILEEIKKLNKPIPLLCEDGSYSSCKEK